MPQKKQPVRRPGGRYDPADRPKVRGVPGDAPRQVPPELRVRTPVRGLMEQWMSPPRSEGEQHAERMAWRSPGTEEQRIARFNEAREAFSGSRMSRGRGIGRTRRRR